MEHKQKSPYFAGVFFVAMQDVSRSLLITKQQSANTDQSSQSACDRRGQFKPGRQVGLSIQPNAEKRKRQADKQVRKAVAKPYIVARPEECDQKPYKKIGENRRKDCHNHDRQSPGSV